MASAMAGASVASGVGAIGLDIGARSIRAVQVVRGAAGGTARVHAAVCVLRGEPGRAVSGREMERLRRILDRQGFEGTAVVLALPEEKLLSNTFEQVGQGAPMDVVSRVELARGAGCAPPQLETACWPLPAPARARQSTHVLAVGCLHSEAEAFLDAVEGAGLRARALEPRAASLTRACEPLVRGSAGICAVVDVGWEGVTTSVLYRDALVYHRFSAELGVGELSRAMVSGLGADEELAEHLLLGRSALPGPEEGGERVGLRADAAQLMGEHASRLAHELGLSLSYASHWYAQPQVDRVLLCGEGAGMPGLAGVLSQGVGAEVRVAGAGEVVGWDGEGEGRGTELLTAVGLALR